MSVAHPKEIKSCADMLAKNSIPMNEIGVCGVGSMPDFVKGLIHLSKLFSAGLEWEINQWAVYSAIDGERRYYLRSCVWIRG
jgi:hypothetical protein